MALNRLRSSEIWNRSFPPFPIAASLRVTATTILIFGFVGSSLDMKNELGILIGTRRERHLSQVPFFLFWFFYKSYFVLQSSKIKKVCPFPSQTLLAAVKEIGCVYKGVGFHSNTIITIKIDGVRNCSHVIVFRRMYEIEIKSLLGSKENADKLRTKLKTRDPKLKLVGQGRQRNHYFKLTSHASQGIAATTNAAHANEDKKSLRVLERAIAPLYQSKEKQQELSRIVENAKGKVSVRTRDANGTVSFILKASIGDDSSANGVSRVEFDEPVKLTLEELDQKLLDAGLSYEAKWSREREEYASGKTHITIDKNAGYGYLAEFERIVDDSGKADEAKRKLMTLMNELGVAELPQERLERMFKHYNEHWVDYYGTDRTFVIK